MAYFHLFHPHMTHLTRNDSFNQVIRVLVILDKYVDLKLDPKTCHNHLSNML